MRRFAICLVILSLALPATAADTEKGWLGLSLLLQHDGTGRSSAIVKLVAPNSAASRANVRPGDVIMAINGEPAMFRDNAQMRAAFADISAGDQVRVMLMRKGVLKLVTMVADVRETLPSR